MSEHELEERCENIKISSKQHMLDVALFEKTTQIGKHVSDLIDWLRNYAQLRPSSENNTQLIFEKFIQEAKNKGLFGLKILTEFGGIDLSLTETAGILEQLAAIDISYAAFLVAQFACGFAIQAHANLNIRSKYLPMMAKGELLGSFALSEPSAGSNPRAMTTIVTPSSEEGKWFINGTKCWVGGAALSGIFIVFAKHKRGPYKGISCFVVPANTIGIEIGDMENMLSVQTIDIRRVTFRNVEISDDNLLGEYGQGMSVAEDALMRGRLFSSALSIGIMKRCAQMMIRYASNRRIGTGLLLENPVTISRLTWLDSAIIAVNCLQKFLSIELDAGRAVPTSALIASKIVSSEFTWEATDSLIQLLGARGLDKRNKASQLLMDARFLRIGEGPTETLLMELGSVLYSKDALTLQFIKTQLTADQTCFRLIEVIDEIHNLTDPSQLEWAYFLLGKLGIWVFLEASLSREFKISSSIAIDDSHTWVLNKFSQELTDVKKSLVNVSSTDAVKKIIERMLSYDKDIGSLDTCFLTKQIRCDLFLKHEFSRDDISICDKVIFSARINLCTDYLSQNSTYSQNTFHADTTDLDISKILNICDETGCELKIVILAAYSILLARLAEQSEIELLFFDTTQQKTIAVTIPVKMTFNFKEFLQQFNNRSLIHEKSWKTPSDALIELRQTNGHSETTSAQNSLMTGISVCFYFGTIPPGSELQGVDLCLIANYGESGLSLSWIYNDIFARETIFLRSNNLNTVLTMMALPHVSIENLDIIPKDELLKIIKMGEGGQTIGVQTNVLETTIPELFEKNLEKLAHSTALHSTEGTVTYDELNKKSNQIAHYLSDLAIQPGDVVAFFMGRTPCFIASLLAVLKLGATLLTLNIRHPKERNQLILVASNAKLILTEQSLQDLLPDSNLKKLSMDRSDLFLNHDAPAFVSRALPQLPAYIIFTSGSTGNPKGVIVSHRAICDQLIARRDLFAIGSQDRILYAAVPNFDIAIWEFFGAFASGASLVLSGDNTFIWDPLDACELIRRYKVTHIQISPTQLNLLLLSDSAKTSCATLKYIFSGGELMPKQVQQIISSILSTKLIHVYGSTEAVLDVACWRCDLENNNSIRHIGRVFPHKRIYVLDKHLQMVPIGVSGELYIAGEVAEGYLGQPELTNIYFLSDPFSKNISSRMYKSGDRVRFLANGELEFLGRVDQQLKINGIRIEPGEIETILEKHHGIKQLRIATRKSLKDKENLILVAYYVQKDAHQVCEKSLRDLAVKMLPKEMVPSLFIRLEALPLTATDKLDTNALSNLDYQQDVLLSKIMTSDPISNVIINLWGKLLEGVVTDETDDFFELGGHSLIAVQLLIHVREIFSVELQMSDFFKNSTIKGLVQLIKQNKAKGNRGDSYDLVPVSRNQIIPLLGTQSNLWYLQQLNLESVAYNCPEAVRLEGQLDIAILKLSLNTIVRRHESLRTLFQIHQSQPVRTVLTHYESDIPLIDFSTLSGDECDLTLKMSLEEQLARPFYFSETTPLFRTVLYKLADNHHVFFWNFHHIIFDGTSAHLFMKELSELYSANIENREPNLPNITIHSIDYMYWQKQYNSDQKLTKQCGFWKKKLDGAPTEIDLSLGHLQPQLISEKGCRVFLELSSELCSELHHFSKKENHTVFEILMTAFLSLIQIISGEDDFTIGTVVAGRRHSSIENVIDNFANTVVLRNTNTTNQSFKTLLTCFRNQMVEVLDNSDIPFEDVVSALQPHRKRYKNPLFNIFASLYNGSVHDLKFSNLEQTTLCLDPKIAKFDLCLALFESLDTVNGYIEFKLDYIQYETVERLADYYIKIIQLIVFNPELCLDAVELVDSEERNLLVNVWNDFRKPFPHDTCMHYLFEEQARKSPNNCAIMFNGVSLTYSQLNQQANKVARYLCYLGIKPGALVGLCIKPSIEMMIGLLGIVKAGGAYVPLDPEIPTQRILYITQQIKATVILTQSELVDRVKKCDGKIICLDSDWHLMEQQDVTDLDIPLTSEHLIYMIFTSGSTGQPKGVKTLHYNVAALLCDTNYMQGCKTDRFAKVNNFAFDISTWEIWTPLILGASLIGIPDQIKLTPDLFVSFIREQGITMMYLPTSLFHSIATEIPTAFNSLNLLIVGGEALDPNKARSILGTNAPKDFINAYGPTEVTCNAAWYDVKQLPLLSKRVPIGRPISNTQFYILNNRQNLLPIGVKGELYVGGAGVSRGYLDEELTKKCFIYNPFDFDKNYTRLYKTGDIVRYLPDGNLEFLGRRDNQVKIRGFRIEIGEIENALRKLSWVQAAIVLIREDSSENKRLLAFVSLKDQSIVSPISELRAYLKTTLPHYMLPSHIMILDELPLNTNGKIDRKKLQRIDVAIDNEDSLKIYPRNEFELRLAQIWEDIIGVSIPSVHANFFDVGGDSLKTIRLVSEINKEFSKQLPLDVLYEEGTIESIAVWLRSNKLRSSGHVLMPLYKEGYLPPLFLVHPLSGSAMCYNPLSRALKYPLYGLQSASLETDVLPKNNVEEIASTYLEAFLSVYRDGPILLGGWSFGGVVAFEMARQLESLGYVVSGILLFDSAAPGKTQKALDLPAILKLCLEEITEQFGIKIALSLDNFEQMNSKHLLSVVLNQVKSCGAYSPDTDTAVLERLVRVCLANANAIDAYIPSSAVQCDIVLFRAADYSRLEDMLFDPAAVQQSCLGWSDMTSKAVSVVEAQGHHMSMLFQPNLELLIPKIRQYIELYVSLTQ